ncbi:ABC transporter ATP-binding protein [Alkalihalobacillus alcalophilus ATCC 27647 = CGMCC 1.3604]|uniref:ABC transporter ATP-binding protein n=1 Tax=Alkalihalobacillus alcalophilus ATCC 27647 = CGMCC 1.3604 TaxID=1218173 RepID=J8TMZ6_ALKAL|nr:ABC transporter ATP-binding protein [Alkalihalobacillus alcalophilus]AFV25681.1 polysaccharide export transporter [Alkalihalobacillus alcalophilus ATCC 27647 = CGMCC 1.3604]MED1561676.1 ABC transporter ATP-binding protein [Alkalihalobacillus alcalophilus]THG90928.1 ABC transporter ATP-binding protein [Alkalihalobacillus alcalophilus ATCC 27647 = CGMCC 1.3604]
MNAVEVNGLSKVFKKAYDKTLKGVFLSSIRKEKKLEQHLALNDVNFSVKKGEAYAIIGKNGAGKSTLFKVISGVIFPDKGSIKLNGTIMPLIELSAGLSRDLSGLENIKLNCAIYGLNKEKINQILPDIIEFAELEDFIDTPVKFYSSGMKARLGFSIAVHIDTDIILIDEVLAVGDKDFKEKCYERILELKAKGKTIIIVSHSLRPLKKICDRALILHKGEVKAIGEINEMIAQYEKQNPKKKKKVKKKVVKEETLVKE